MKVKTGWIRILWPHSLHAGKSMNANVLIAAIVGAAFLAAAVFAVFTAPADAVADAVAGPVEACPGPLRPGMNSRQRAPPVPLILLKKLVIPPRNPTHDPFQCPASSTRGTSAYMSTRT